MNVAIARTPAGDVADRLTETIAAIDDLSLVDPAAADVLLAVDDGVLRAAVDGDGDTDGDGNADSGADAADDDTNGDADAAADDDTDARPLLRLPATDTDDTPADRSTLLEALAAHSATTVPTMARRVLSVQAGETTTRAVRDCAIVTTDPARISEYRAVTEGTTLTTFRADGVVVATPLGTATYSRAAGGPRLAADTGLAVVPIAPFAMAADHWVVSPPLTLRVERDDDVSVLADGRRVASGGADLTVSVSVAGSITVVDGRRLAERGRNWKNSNESSPQN